ncbi:aspartyl-phosphate phosphatase Spo0E family protein [Bacillus sp. JJ1533]
MRKRDEMIRLATSNGLLNSKTIKCSQELDRLLNAYKKFQIH